MVDLARISIVVNLPLPNLVKKLCTVLGNTGYYRKFIKGYVQIKTSMEKLLKWDAKYEWTQECQQSLDILKEKMVTTLILVFPDWKFPFHVHVDGSFIALGVILAQLGEWGLDHPIYFARRNSSAECNYTTTEREGLVMVYAL